VGRPTQGSRLYLGGFYGFKLELCADAIVSAAARRSILVGAGRKIFYKFLLS